MPVQSLMSVYEMDVNKINRGDNEIQKHKIEL